MSSMARLLNRLRSDLHVRRIAKVVTLESGDAPNLKTVLKHIIREATTGDDADLDPPSTGAQNVWLFPIADPHVKSRSMLIEVERE